MKIALLAHLKHPIGQPFGGGLEMHTHLLTRMLRRRGHAVTLFCASGSDPALRAVELCPPTGEGTGDPARDAGIAAAEAATYEAMMTAVASGGFDLVHNNSLHALPLLKSGRLAAPMVTVLHTPRFEPLGAGVRAAVSRFAAVSNAVLAEWREIAPGARVIGNGIDLAAFPFRVRAEHAGHAVWFGRIVPEKGLHLAIDAARAAGLPLAFAGPRGDAAYWRAAILPRLGPDLTDLGHLGQADLAARVGAAQVALVTPRWEEPFGLVVAEALACGTPVAGFARGALSDIVDERSGRLAAPDDVNGLAHALREARHLDRRDCRARAEALFDVETMTDRYEALYAEALTERGIGHGIPADLDLAGA